MIDHGDLTEKPGWVRISLHPTMTNQEAEYIGRAVSEVVNHYKEWAVDYTFIPASGDFECNVCYDNPVPTLKDFK